MNQEGSKKPLIIFLCSLIAIFAFALYRLQKEYTDARNHRKKMEKYIERMESFICDEQDDMSIRIRKIEDTIYKNKRR